MGDERTAVEDGFDAVNNAKNAYMTAKDAYDDAVTAVSGKTTVNDNADLDFINTLNDKSNTSTGIPKLCADAEDAYDAAVDAVADNIKTRKHTQHLVQVR